MATFEHSQPIYEVPANLLDRIERETTDQRRQASEVFERVHHEGAERFGINWLLLHMTIRHLTEADYLPTGQWGETDARIKAIFAEIAYAILSQYELVVRKQEEKGT